MNDLGKVLRAAREKRGWSQDYVAERVNSSQSTIDRIERNQVGHSRVIHKLAALLELHETDPLTQKTVARDPFRADSTAKYSAELPIYGTAEGGEGSLIMSVAVVDTIARPIPLANVPDAYGLYCIGESMSPRYRPGDTLLIHPHLPPRPEDGIILYSRDDERVQVKEFVRSTADHWVIRRYQPQEEEFQLLKSEWPKCHVVYGSYSRR